MSNEKRCGRCKEIKPITEFHKCKSRKDGLQNACKKCRREINKERYDKNKDALNLRSGEWKKNNRERATIQNKKWEEKAMKNNNLGIGYSALHKKMRKMIIKPETCQKCNQPKYLELASINHVYTTNPEDWIYVCISCHKELDRGVEIE